MAAFKAGDVVVLKSGGPPMTVVEVGTTDGWPKCVYFLNSEAKFFATAPDALETFAGVKPLSGASTT